MSIDWTLKAEADLWSVVGEMRCGWGEFKRQERAGGGGRFLYLYSQGRSSVISFPY
jgi:hypothetical protein